VTSVSPGINCGNDCSESYVVGTFVTLTASPASGSTFAGWSGACTGTGSCTVSMTTARNVTATFNSTSGGGGGGTSSYSLSVSRNGTGTGTVTSNPSGVSCGSDCSQSYSSGTSVNLTASPASGSTFAGWSGACTGTGSCTVSMTTARTVTATFNSTSGGGGGTTGSIVVVDRQWVCKGPVNLDLVKVTQHASSNGIYIDSGCTGRIGRIEIDTWTYDGLKISAKAPVAHDLTIGGGYITCHAWSGGNLHQDGIQVMGGTRVSLNNLQVRCPTSPNAALFINGGGSTMPTDVVCTGCFFGGGAVTTVRVNHSTRSGIRNSTVCPSPVGPIYFVPGGPVDPVNVGNTILSAGDSRCQ
jgi:hypothetical protein